MIAVAVMPPNRPSNLIVAVAFGLAFAGIVGHASCTPPASAQQAAAEAAYGAALLRCVDEAGTLAESKACRARVDAEWGITQTASDGGAR
ncbi:MAG: hypothetical protein KF894_29620 [Labilithrix sp.]|nr:hypothetical protein [Labilithrix sp.]